MGRDAVEKTSARRRGTFAFGIVANDGNLRTPLERLCSSLSQRLDILIYPQVLRSYSALATSIAGGGIDLAWLPPLIACEAVASGRVELVASVQRELGGLYHSVLFARRGAGIGVLGDLRGRSIAWVDRQSASGYVLPRRWLEQNGFSPKTMFAREMFAGTHIDVVRQVLRGGVDAGATFAVLEPRSRKILEAGWTAVPEGADLVTVVGSAGAVPADAIAVSLRVQPEIRAELADVLLRLDAAERDLAKLVFNARSFERCAPVYLEMLERLGEPT